MKRFLKVVGFPSDAEHPFLLLRLAILIHSAALTAFALWLVFLRF